MYKVLRKLSGRLRSCTVEGKNAGVTYIPGKEIRAPKWLADKGYHLCIFENLRDAMKFSRSNIQDAIWKVKAREVIRKLPYMLDTGFLKNKEIVNSCSHWPKGTVMAKIVILTEEVNRRESRDRRRRRRRESRDRRGSRDQRR